MGVTDLHCVSKWSDSLTHTTLRVSCFLITTGRPWNHVARKGQVKVRLWLGYAKVILLQVLLTN